MIACHMCRNGTGHKRGFVYRCDRLEEYLLLHFRTDFFLEVDGQTLYGEAGDWVIHRPGSCVAHGHRTRHEGFINDWLFFTAEPEDEPWLSLLPYDRPIPVAAAEQFPRSVSTIMEEQIRNDPFSSRLISDHIYALLATLSRAARTAADHPDTLYAQFQELRTNILKHCTQRWTLQSMAELSGYSVSRFCELYKQFFRKSPMEDLLDERLELSKRLLSLKSCSVGEIAEQCGFSSLHYFSSFFKKRTGFTPTEY